jgi:DmsE family decaheme c-type cytochrome
MPRNTRIWLAGTTAALALVLGWGVAGAQTRKSVDWVALNPTFAGATFVNDAETCLTCHDDVRAGFHETKHAKAVSSGGGAVGCESCHGPRSKHIENPTAELRLESNSRSEAATCLQCHQSGPRLGWKAGTHQANDVGCTSCHTVMERKSDRALLMKASTSDTCFSCHADVRAETNKMSHHPVREGRMDCANCHNVHGSAPSLLVKNTVNDTCYSCHTEKRGPFLWEHAPARESCVNCHTPHGSTQPNLLASRAPFLCLNCHSYGGHVNLPRYNRVSNPYGSGCANCHISVHGSNHPSGAKLTR